MQKSYRDVTEGAKPCPLSTGCKWASHLSGAAPDAAGLCLKYRRAKNSDIWNILAWRNHPTARRWSFNHKKILRQEHKWWFASKIADKNTRIYIAQTPAGAKVGQIRFDRKRDFAEVSICLNPKYYGRGYGTETIGRATRRYLSENPGVKEVRATVITANAASKNAFRKAGYAVSYYGVKAGSRAVVLKRKR